MANTVRAECLGQLPPLLGSIEERLYRMGKRGWTVIVLTFAFFIGCTLLAVYIDLKASE